MRTEITLFLLLFNSHLSFGQNLILNSGFEDGNSHWLEVTPNPSLALFEVDDQIFHSGSASGKIISNVTSDNGTGFIQMPNLEQNKSYELSYWIRSESLDSYLFSFVQFLNINDDVITQVAHPIASEDSNWQNIKFRFKAPSNTEKAILSVFVFNSGIFWLDDVSLIGLTDTSAHNFSADLQNITTPIKKLLGTNTGPKNPFGNQDYSSKFKEIGIDFVRTHDYHIAFDHHVIFPDTTKSPDDPSAYDFSTTDELVAGIMSADSKILYRLGESAGGNYNAPPANNNKWAQVAVHIIRHYNDNWNNGFEYDIKYWEIWNEPDLHEFWTGTMEQYIDLYKTTAIAIKSYDSTLSVGGPTLAVAYDNRWINTFLKTVSQNSIPLDFFSYHLYDLFNPYNSATVTNHVKQKLLEYNLLDTELILDEWNPYPFNPLPSNYGKVDALNAASTVSGINYLQKTSIDKLFRYSTDMLDFPLLNFDETYTYQGFAYKAVGEYTRMGNNIKTAGGDSLGTTISAGKSTNGVKSVILISDNASSAEGYNLNIDGISDNEIWNYEITRLDEDKEYVVVETGSLTKNSHLITQNAISPYVDQITLSLNIVSSLTDELSDKEIIAFPNPYKDEITLSVPNKIWNTLSINNSSGEEIFKDKFRRSITVDTKHFPFGILYYKVSNVKGTIKTGKIVK